MSSVPSAQVCSRRFEVPGRWFRTGQQFALFTASSRRGCVLRSAFAASARFFLCALLCFHLAAASLGGTAFTATSLKGMYQAAPLLVSVQGGGGVTRTPDKPLYNYGENVMLTATNRPYYQFVRWSDGLTSSTRTITAGQINHLIAIFTNSVPLETLVFKLSEKVYGGSDYDLSTRIIATADGGYLLAGASFSDVSGNKTAPAFGQADVWIFKLDAHCDKQWERTFGGFAGDYPVKVFPVVGGGYLLACYSSSSASGNKTNAGFGGDDFWLLKLDANGNKLSEWTYGGDGSDYALDMVPTGDGGYLLVGASQSGISGNKTAPGFGDDDIWLVRIDANGNKLWDHSYGGTGNDQAYGLQPAGDGGFFVFGFSSSGVDGNKTSPRLGSNDCWLIKIDGAGNKIWERVYGGEGDDYGYQIEPTGDGGYLLAGESASESSPTKSAPRFGESDTWIVRIDANGNRITDTAFGGINSEAPYFVRKSVRDGGYLSGNYSASPASGNKTAPYFGSYDAWLLKTDAGLNKQWDFSIGTEEFDEVLDFVELADGTLILSADAGSSVTGNKLTPGFGSNDVWIVTLFPREAPVGTPVILADGQFHPTGSYTSSSAVQVEIQSTFPDAIILYSVDGSSPADGPFYEGPFTLDASAIIRAVAYSSDFIQSQETGPFILTVEAVPEIFEQPESQFAVPGADVTFSVAAIGSKPLAYQWFVNGAVIPGATDASLSLANVQFADAGTYQVAVSNLFGSALSIGATLAILSPPDLNVQPASTNMAPGGDVTFCVTASGTPPLSYQWRKNGANIPGATASCFSIASVQVSDGGIYNVLVANAAGTLLSDDARLIVNVSSRPPGNNFLQRVGISNAVGTISGSNVLANMEAGEPNHAGKVGGASVWYRWRAPFAGMAVFNTRGSTFDTLLAVYRGTNVTALTSVANDEDGGGFGTSELRYNTEEGVEYQIVIDGFAGAQGYFVLDWKLISVSEPLPEITLQPKSQTVSAGAEVTLVIEAVGTNLTYQWYFNNSPLTDGTRATLVVSNTQPENVGTYFARVINESGLSVDSQPASLEIGPVFDTVSEDKFEDLFRTNSSPPGFAGRGLALSAAVASASSGFLPVSMGTIESQVLNNTGSGTQQGEPPPCGTIGGSSKWFGLRPEADGLMQIDTSGSSFDTVIAVYTGTNNIFTLKTVACDNNGAPDGIRSLVKFPAKGGTNYAIAVDGVNGAQGTIALNWRLGLPPAFMTPTQTSYTANLGDSLTLTAAGLSPTADLTFQWLLNGLVISGQTRSNLVHQSLEASHAGTYKAVLRNFAGSVTGTVATVTVATPVQLTAAIELSNSAPMLHLSGVPGRGYVIESSSNLTQWAPLHTNSSTFSPIQFVDPVAPNAPQRFYRVRPWP